jgi:hypothetical protein
LSENGKSIQRAPALAPTDPVSTWGCQILIAADTAARPETDELRFEELSNAEQS